MKKSFVSCPDCEVWADLPAGFDERKHFGKCPKCGKGMFLTRGMDPKEVGLPQNKKVEAGLLENGDKVR